MILNLRKNSPPFEQTNLDIDGKKFLVCCYYCGCFEANLGYAVWKQHYPDYKSSRLPVCSSAFKWSWHWMGRFSWNIYKSGYVICFRSNTTGGLIRLSRKNIAQECMKQSMLKILRCGMRFQTAGDGFERFNPFINFSWRSSGILIKSDAVCFMGNSSISLLWIGCFGIIALFKARKKCLPT